MDVTENTGISFAVNTLDDKPTPKKNAKEITRLTINQSFPDEI